MHKILVVEDDHNILTGLVDVLKMDNLHPIIARDGESALKQAAEKHPDLIILDVGLPKLDGFEVCKRLKKNGINIPIIILSSRSEEMDKVLGLELGADDYVTKPFSPRELLVRIKAVLRRSKGALNLEDVYSFGEVRVDFKKLQVFKKEREIKLTPAEFKVLKLLVSNKNEPISRHKLLAEIWGEGVSSRSVDTHIYNLREKLEDNPENPQHLITVHRIGYKFVCNLESQPL